MGVHTRPQDVIVVNLPRELERHNELQTIIETLRRQSDRHVVVDFSRVDVVGSMTFSRLLELRSLLRAAGHRLVLCNVAPATKGVFTVALLDRLFDFAKDKSAAMESLQGSQ